MKYWKEIAFEYFGKENDYWTNTEKYRQRIAKWQVTAIRQMNKQL